MSSLILKLNADHPRLTFTKAEHFSWSPTTSTVTYNADAANAPQLLLHEVSHALLDHHEYHRDIQLLSMETSAWEHAKKLGSQYEQEISEDTIQDHLDTYRDWMHARSTCPECTATGYQSDSATYTCPACTHEWRVNEARVCGLKRYSTRT